MILKTDKEIKALMIKMVDDNQEGLVLKDSEGVYAPNKRHWLKMKKDYLSIDIDGEPNTSMADSADLIVLGAYKGHGRHGGLYSTFLMGTLDKTCNRFMTVCKGHNGLSDDQIKFYTESLKSSMIPFDTDNCPQWLSVTKTLEPDWIVKNPKKSPIFEISGFEFSNSKVHTATDEDGQGFSIRFPRITRIRDDKKYKDATSLSELRALIKVSRNINPLKRGHDNDDNDDFEPPTKKRKINADNTNTNIKKEEKEDEEEDEDEDIDIKDNDDDGDIALQSPSLPIHISPLLLLISYLY